MSREKIWPCTNNNELITKIFAYYATTSDFGAMSSAKLKCKVISTVNYYNYENINSFLV